MCGLRTASSRRISSYGAMKWSSSTTRLEALEEVRLYSLSGTYLGVARRYEREKGSHPEVRENGARRADHAPLSGRSAERL